MNHSEGHYNRQEKDNKNSEPGFIHSLLSTFSRKGKQENQPSSESGDANEHTKPHLLTMLLIKSIPYIIFFVVSALINLAKKEDNNYSSPKSTCDKDRTKHSNHTKSKNNKVYKAYTKQTEAEREYLDRQPEVNDRDYQAQVRHLLLDNIKTVEKNEYSEHNILSVSSNSVVDFIDEQSFASCPKLKSVELDCKVIGVDAFTNCPSLKSVIIKDHINWIRKGAFSNCPQLESVLLGTTLSTVEDSIFYNSPRIREVSIPNNVRTHYFRQFHGCHEISTIYLLTFAYFKMPKSIKEAPLKFDQCILYVLDAKLKDFRANPDWAMFKEIRPLSKSRYYNAQGWWK